MLVEEMGDILSDIKAIRKFVVLRIRQYKNKINEYEGEFIRDLRKTLFASIIDPKRDYCEN